MLDYPPAILTDQVALNTISAIEGQQNTISIESPSDSTLATCYETAMEQFRTATTSTYVGMVTEGTDALPALAQIIMASAEPDYGMENCRIAD